MFTGSAACSSTQASDIGGSGYDDPYGQAGSGGLDDDDHAESGASPGDADADESSGGVDPGSTGDGSESGAEPPPPGAYDGCPDPLPDSWVFCEDFESVTDPAEVFFDYSSGNGAFERVEDGGSSGVASMRVTYPEGAEAAGFLSVSFGQNPIEGAGRPGYKPGLNFQEIYWRFRVKMEAGWPDVGPWGLSRATSFAGPDWGQAMIASLGSDGDDVTLLGTGATCVFGSEVACEGYEDTASLDPLELLPGKTPLFSADLAGQWHCVEAHVRLNTPGSPDGVFEYWVDDERENGSDAIDWRGEWDEYGLNLITLENFWLGGAPVELQRSFDDLVIAQDRIGCE